jgi:hypothetical protein
LLNHYQRMPRLSLLMKISKNIMLRLSGKRPLFLITA